MNIKFDDVEEVTLTKGRWMLFITLRLKSGEVQQYVATADSHYTGNSGIWFGTAQEFEDER